MKGYLFQLITGLLIGGAMAPSPVVAPAVLPQRLLRSMHAGALTNGSFDSRPVTLIVTYEIDTEHTGAATVDFFHLREAACRQPGVVSFFVVERDAGLMSEFVLIEVYRNRQSLEAFRHSAAFVRYASAGLHVIARSHTARSFFPVSPVSGYLAPCR